MMAGPSGTAPNEKLLVTVPRSTYRYSSFADQLEFQSAVSTPPPTVHPPRFVLKLADDMGQKRIEGIFIPLALSRQEIADMIGTTIETSIRIMSRWGKDNIVRTEKDGFLILDRAALESVAMS